MLSSEGDRHVITNCSIRDQNKFLNKAATCLEIQLEKSSSLKELGTQLWKEMGSGAGRGPAVSYVSCLCCRKKEVDEMAKVV